MTVHRIDRGSVHRVDRSVCMEDASWVLDCRCGVRFFAKDRAEAYQAWKRHAESKSAPS
jgi:hypothetical protein